jgi:precorrin-6B C5,15-methyltransferase / cobalt-precorrin-6B C5,C15-methyltransferase
MSETPWLTIIGLGEDGPEGLSDASHVALEKAEIIIGPPRHLALLGKHAAKQVEWPVPFADGVDLLLGFRGRPVVMLASGDPFWFGAGSVVTRRLAPHEWAAIPGVSTFSLAASQLGWPLEQTTCLGLHATPLTRLRPHLYQGERAIVLLRDGAAVLELAGLLNQTGFGPSTLHVLEALGGPCARHRQGEATTLAFDDISHPVCVGIEVAGDGQPIGLSAGRSDAIFESDGQITKRPVRALTLSALAPRPGEHLWDIGGGSGSIAIEWLLGDPSLTATTIEPRPERAARIRRNADRLGMDRLQVVTGLAPEALTGLDTPDVVFIGGGLSENLLVWLQANLPNGARIVANVVTLESESLLAHWQAKLGGDLLRIELAQSGPLGSKRAWRPNLPVVQWSVTL